MGMPRELLDPPLPTGRAAAQHVSRDAGVLAILAR